MITLKDQANDPEYFYFMHAGLECRIIVIHNKEFMSVMTSAGKALFANSALFKYPYNVNGYVAVPRGHRLYGKKYSKFAVNVHGGLTYSDQHYPNEPEPYSKKLWWFGFDTGHGMDDNRTKNIVYVKDECKYLADQLAEYGK
jgi:hypothetical protein